MESWRETKGRWRKGGRGDEMERDKGKVKEGWVMRWRETWGKVEGGKGGEMEKAARGRWRKELEVWSDKGKMEGGRGEEMDRDKGKVEGGRECEEMERDRGKVQERVGRRKGRWRGGLS